MAMDDKLKFFWDFTKAGAIAIWWSAIAVLFDWLGDVLTFVAKLLYAVGAVARGPTPAPQVEIQRRSLDGEINGRDSPLVKHEKDPLQVRPDLGAEDIKVQDELYSSDLLHRQFHSAECQHHELRSEVRPKFRAEVKPHIYLRQEAVQEHRGESREDLDRNLVEILPEFLCNVRCHRSWRKWYAIVIGRQAGLYDCWDCAEPQVKKFSGQKYKSFPLKTDAMHFFRTERHCLQNHLIGQG